LEVGDRPIQSLKDLRRRLAIVMTIDALSLKSLQVSYEDAVVRERQLPGAVDHHIPLRVVFPEKAPMTLTLFFFNEEQV
jgi:hypothetical protein